LHRQRPLDFDMDRDTLNASGRIDARRGEVEGEKRGVQSDGCVCVSEAGPGTGRGPGSLPGALPITKTGQRVERERG
jgi:hypothetical protein